MSVPQNIVGTVYTAAQVSEGTINSTSANPILFTESQFLANQKVFGTALGPNATATVTATGTDANGNPTLTFKIGNSGTFADGQSITGSVIGNDPTDLLVSGNILGTQGYLYITNLAAQQPGVGNTVPVVAESTALPYVTPACYCRGTLIRTSGGYKRVEDLVAGDLVVTASGAQRPVRWVGRRSYAARFVATHPALRPVLFRAGSLGDGLPLRDLRVSPQHAMFLEGVLVPARLLVDGVSVVQERTRETVEYFHVELDSHDLLLAEGAASESFVDDNSRGMFHNAHEFHAAHPGEVARPAVFCAPRVEDGPALDAVLAFRRAGRESLAA